MRYLPVFLDLYSGTVALIGAGDFARAKLRLLVAAGARIRWYATSGAHDVSGLEPAQLARIEFAKGDPLSADLSGIVALFCAGAGEVGVAMSQRAKSAGLPVNVMDDVAHSTFIFPAIVDRGDVVVAIGTGGTSPVLARRVRERIEAVLPARIGDLAKFIGRFRKSVRDRIPDMLLRRRFWEHVIDGRIGALVLSGQKDEAEAELEQISDPSRFAGADARGQPQGSVTLVGTGPGDADLLTVRALRTLQDADIVVHDEGISREIVDRIRRDASRVAIAGDDINRLIIEAAQAGHRVVRLVGGDGVAPTSNDVIALREAGIACFVVPGVAADPAAVRPRHSSATRSQILRRHVATTAVD